MELGAAERSAFAQLVQEREDPRASRGVAREAALERARDKAELERLQAARKAAAARRATAARKAEAARKAAAERKARNSWVLPLRSYRLSAGFGATSGLWSSSHTGLDFAAPYGTAVRAVGTGVVTEAGYAGAYGNRLIVRHSDGTETWYCHLADFVVRRGSVRAGQVIGRVGSTGNSTGNHLHLEVRPNGEGGDPVDPESWLHAKGLRF
jgi:murein DD-endopeptidase MepM/ murein hydrolase activator NlpD